MPGSLASPVPQFPAPLPRRVGGGKTRQKVLAAAETLGYQVNIIARTMNTGSSNFIGIVTAGFDNPFRSKLLSPLVHQLALNGFMPLLMNADDPQQLAPSLRQLLSYHVAGVIITSGAPPLSLAEEYLERKIPVTLINRHADWPAAIACAATTRRARSWSPTCVLSASGARPGLSAKVWITSAPASATKRLLPIAGHGDRRALLRQQRLSGGICRRQTAACRTSAAAGALLRHRYAGARRLDGLRADNPAASLPAIIGFDDIPQADWQPYQLTTVQQNTALLAHHAVDLLVTRIAKFSLPSRHREVPVKLIVRQSAK